MTIRLKKSFSGNFPAYLFLFLPAVMLVLLSCGNREGATSKAVVIDNLPEAAVKSEPGVAQIEFDTLVHDFGVLEEGEKVIYNFVYRNSGSSDLILNEVESTCGCTIPDWSKEPLTPGREAELKVVFNSEGKSGKQVKQIAVGSNGSERPVFLTILAEVKE